MTVVREAAHSLSMDLRHGRRWTIHTHFLRRCTRGLRLVYRSFEIGLAHGELAPGVHILRRRQRWERVRRRGSWSTFGHRRGAGFFGFSTATVVNVVAGQISSLAAGTRRMEAITFCLSSCELNVIKLLLVYRFAPCTFFRTYLGKSCKPQFWGPSTTGCEEPCLKQSRRAF